MQKNPTNNKKHLYYFAEGKSECCRLVYWLCDTLLSYIYQVEGFC